MKIYAICRMAILESSFQLGDFGLAKSCFEATPMCSFVGTPAYIAPEIQGMKDSYTCAVDV